MPLEIIRTRDEDVIKSLNKEQGYVVDVGGVYDEEENKFDHHQKGGAGKRPNGIDYSSFGLVWKKFGSTIADSERAAGVIDQNLVAPIDAHDNGVSLMDKTHEVTPYIIQNFFANMRPTWREGDENMDKIFLHCVEIAKEVLWREIIQTKDALEAEVYVMEAYQKSDNKKIIVLDKNYPCQIFGNLPEPIFVVYPRTDGTWGAKTVQNDPKSFKVRKSFPASWGRLKDQELSEISGVTDAVFCHGALYFAIAKSKEGAIKLAQVALESK